MRMNTFVPPLTMSTQAATNGLSLAVGPPHNPSPDRTTRRRCMGFGRSKGRARTESTGQTRCCRPRTGCGGLRRRSSSGRLECALRPDRGSRCHCGACRRHGRRRQWASSRRRPPRPRPRAGSALRALFTRASVRRPRQWCRACGWSVGQSRGGLTTGAFGGHPELRYGASVHPLGAFDPLASTPLITQLALSLKSWDLARS